MDNKEKGPFTLAQGQRDGKPWFAIIREKFTSFERKADLPWLLTIDIDAEATELGLVSDEEGEVLNKLEDFFEGKMNAVGQIFFVARTTWNGIRSLFYYVADPKAIAHQLNLLIEQAQHPREFEYKIEKDADWKKMSEVIPNIETL